MNGIIACTLTSASTGISCIIKVFIETPKGSTPYPWWKKDQGALFDKSPYSDAGPWKIGGGRLGIIGFIPGFALPYVPVGPIIEDIPEPLTVAELYDVPNDFLEAVTTENILRGEGKLIVTREKLNWMMWYSNFLSLGR